MSQLHCQRRVRAGAAILVAAASLVGAASPAAAQVPTPSPSPTPTASPADRVVTIKLPASRRIPPPEPIIGRVLELDGRPAVGVKVLFSVRRFGDGAPAFVPVAKATADEAGEFIVPARGESRVLRATVMTPGVTAKPKDST